MIIDELIDKKEKKIKEHENKFPDDTVSLEMFTKKYEGSYYSNRNIHCIQPFINELNLPINGLCDKEYIDSRNLPKINDPIYSEIEEFPDYDYINSIAYEMLIRTTEYKALRHHASKDSYDEKIKKFDLLGLDINDVYDLKKKKDTFSNSNFKMRIGDIEQGINRLINFYINKKQIRKIDYEGNKSVHKTIEVNNDYTFKIITNIRLEDIKASISSYYIPVKFDYQTLAHNDDELAVIDNNIPLVALHYDFLLSIEELIPNRIKGSIDFNFTRPLLRFKELPIVDVPINLNLSKEELTQLVLKLKDDFEEDSIKNPINLLYNRKYNVEELKNITPFKMTKKSVAEAFFIYDLYQAIHSAMSSHKQKLSKFKQLDKEKIENDIKLKKEKKEKEINKIIEKLKVDYKDKKILKKKCEENKRDLRVSKRKLEKKKKEKISSINKLYKEYSKNYHTMTVLKDLVPKKDSDQKKDISPYICKQYLQFMRKYIEELRFKELVIGIEV